MWELGVDRVDEKEVKDKILKHFKGFVWMWGFKKMIHYQLLIFSFK
jgi:methionine salvage enolase-phosphatase E1